MAKKFNVTGLCVPDKHYMVDLTERIRQIRKMVDAGDYFTINRARQYGKTTTLVALAKELSKDYLVVSLDFQAIGSASFASENEFAFAFLRLFLRELKRHREMETKDISEFVTEMQKVVNAGGQQFDFMELFEYLLNFCEGSKKPLVLIIDEVDSASNNQVFIDFLAQLRNYYLERG